jgi:hypothetical protein
MNFLMPVLLPNPLCPAGGDQAFIFARSQSQQGIIELRGWRKLISPLVGEMSGRTEGGMSGRKRRRS